MRHNYPYPEFDKVATIDIETTHYDAEQGEVVAIGIAIHEPETPGTNVNYRIFYRKPAVDEAGIIRTAFYQLWESEANLLISYNGGDFDIPFLTQRMEILDEEVREEPFGSIKRIDLFAGRKQRADEQDQKYPSLEDCLESYDVEPATTYWKDEPITNKRFGEEIGPAYLDAVAESDTTRMTQLCKPIDHYLRTDLEHNLTLYYSDASVPFLPAYAGDTAEYTFNPIMEECDVCYEESDDCEEWTWIDWNGGYFFNICARCRREIRQISGKTCPVCKEKREMGKSEGFSPMRATPVDRYDGCDDCRSRVVFGEASKSEPAWVN